MKYILQRLVFYIVAAFVAVSLSFFIPHALPGNPIEAEIANLTKGGSNVTPQTICAIARQTATYTPHCGLHKVGILTQYWDYIVNLLHGNLGYSPSEGESVSHVIGMTLPWTVLLVGISTVLSFLLGTLAGIVSAWRRGGLLDGSLPYVSFFQGMPYFILGLLLLTLFSRVFNLFPSSGGVSPGITQGWNWAFIASALDHSVVPALTLVLASLAGWWMGMRNVMITTVSEEYVLAAQAKGLSNWRVITTYAARNAILPNIAGLANAASLVVSGAIIMEVVFSYPGVGNMMLNAVTNDDYTLASGLFIVIAISVLAAMFIADGVYVLLDPRLRRKAAS